MGGSSWRAASTVAGRMWGPRAPTCFMMECTCSTRLSVTHTCKELPTYIVRCCCHVSQRHQARIRKNPTRRGGTSLPSIW